MVATLRPIGAGSGTGAAGEFSIQLPAFPSLSDTVFSIRISRITQARSTEHNWVRKADRQTTSRRDPDHVAVDERMVSLDSQQYWLYAAASTVSTVYLHLIQFSTQNSR